MALSGLEGELVKKWSPFCSWTQTWGMTALEYDPSMDL